MRRFAFAVFVVVSLLALSAPVYAGNGDLHCVVEVEHEQASGQLVGRAARCYQTFAEVISDVSKGSISVPESFTGADLLASPTVAARLSDFILGTHFEGASGSGTSISVTGGSCSGGYWNTGTAWANRISSSYNGCGRLAHYDLPGKSGSVESTYGAGTTDNLGFMNNRTESVAYFSS